MQVMERPGVRSETNGPVTTIILDRPARRNAVDPPTAAALRAAFRAFERDREARVAVLCGAHGTFCAGYDLKAFAAAPPRHPRPYGEGPMGPTRMRLGKPVIAAVSGYAVAGGLELALWCDLRVVEEDAIMGVFNRRWGVPLIDGGTARLPAVVGLGRALDLILTGRPVDAREAERIGLASRVVAEGDERPEACADVPGPARLLVARLEQLVGDVERGERERLQRVLHARTLELRHALFHELRELADVVGRGVGAEREGLAEEGQLDALGRAHSCLSGSSLAMSFRIASTWACTCLRSSVSRRTSRVS